MAETVRSFECKVPLRLEVMAVSAIEADLGNMFRQLPLFARGVQAPNYGGSYSLATHHVDRGRGISVFLGQRESACPCQPKLQTWSKGFA